MNRRTWSLCHELNAIRKVVDAARILCDAATASYGTEVDAEIMPEAISAVLSLVSCRLGLVRRAIRQSVDPALVWAAHNDAAPELDPSADPDVLLKERTSSERMRRARQELAVAEPHHPRDAGRGRADPEDDRS